MGDNTQLVRRVSNPPFLFLLKDAALLPIFSCHLAVQSNLCNLCNLWIFLYWVNDAIYPIPGLQLSSCYTPKINFSVFSVEALDRAVAYGPVLSRGSPWLSNLRFHR